MKIFGQDVVDGAFIWECFATIFATAGLIIALELLCWDGEWHAKVTKRKDIRDLYLSAIRQNLLAGFVLGPPVYGLVTSFLASQDAYYPWFVSIPGVILVQGIMYSGLHYWMHKPENYAWTHKYHHQFNMNTFVRPISANAVTVAELLLAYIFPLTVGTLLFRPTKEDMYNVLMISSLANLLIHTPASALPFAACLPDWMCSNVKHFLHHEKNVKTHYSAPVFDLDYALGLDHMVTIKCEE